MTEKNDSINNTTNKQSLSNGDPVIDKKNKTLLIVMFLIFAFFVVGGLVLAAEHYQHEYEQSHKWKANEFLE